MTIEWPSFFECPECGQRDPSTQVKYDRLGYPVCPSCGSHEGPAVES